MPNYVATRTFNDPGAALRLGNAFKDFAVRPTADRKKYIVEVTVRCASPEAAGIAGADLEKRLDILTDEWRLW